MRICRQSLGFLSILLLFTVSQVYAQDDSSKYYRPSIEWSRDGQILMVTNTSHACIYDVSEFYAIQYIEYHSLVTSAVLDADNNLLTAHEDGTIETWDIEDGSSSVWNNRFDASIDAITLNADGSVLLMTSRDERRVKLWDMTTQSVYADISNEFSCDFCVAPMMLSDFSPDGQYFAMESRDYAPDGNRALLWLWDIVANEEYKVLSYPDELSFIAYQSIPSIDFNHNNRLIVASTDRSLVMFWSVETGEYLDSLGLTDSGLTMARFSPTDDLLVMGGHELMFAEVALIDSTLEIGELRFSNENSRILNLAFRPDGEYLATVDDEGNVNLYNVELQQKVVSLTSCQFSE